jgi:HEAT repeat protein
MKTLMKLSVAFVLFLLISSAVSAQTPAVAEQEYNQYLINALKDQNIGIRTSAAQLLGERKVKEAVKPLVKALQNEEKYNARIVYALALYHIGDETVVPELKKLAKCDNCKTVRHIMLAIVKEMQSVQVAQK